MNLQKNDYKITLVQKFICKYKKNLLTLRTFRIEQ